MASGHVSRIKRPNTWLHRPMLQNVKKALANSEPSTHGTNRTSSDVRLESAFGGRAENICSQRVFRLLTQAEIPYALARRTATTDAGRKFPPCTSCRKAYYSHPFSPDTNDPDTAGGDDRADKTWICRVCILCTVWACRVRCDRSVGARHAATGSGGLHAKDSVADGRADARLRDARRRGQHRSGHLSGAAYAPGNRIRLRRFRRSRAADRGTADAHAEAGRRLPSAGRNTACRCQERRHKDSGRQHLCRGEGQAARVPSLIKSKVPTNSFRKTISRKATLVGGLSSFKVGVRCPPKADIGPSPTAVRRALMCWAEFPILGAFFDRRAGGTAFGGNSSG